MLSWLARQTRRLVTGYPTSLTPESHNAWLAEQVQAYATPQPFAGPLTSSSDNLTGETWEIREGYRRYAFKEPSVKASLLTKIIAVSQLDLQVIPFDRNDKRDREIASWVKFSVSRSKGGSPALVQKIGLMALVDGFSVTEKVIGTIPTESPKYGGFWTLAEAKDKDTRGIRFRLDVYKNLVGVRSMVAAQGGLEFSPKDFLVFTHLPIFGNPFGISDLRAANRAANLIEASIKLRAILLENFSGPYLVGTAQDPTARSRIMEILKTARARGWIVVPEGATVQVMNLATSAPDQFQSTIEDLRQEIVTAIQGAYLQLLEGGVTDGRGNTQVHKGVAELFQWWLATSISSVLNDSLIADLVYPNYGYNVGLPTVQLGGIDVQAILAELDRFKRGQDLGVTISARQVAEIGGFESPEDDTDKLKPPGQGSPGPMGGGGGPGGGGDPFDLSGMFGPDGNPPSDGGAGGNVQTEQTGGDPASQGQDTQAFAQFAVTWNPGKSPASGAQGFISSGGQFRKTLPKGAKTGAPPPGKAQVRQSSNAAATNVVSLLAQGKAPSSADLSAFAGHVGNLTLAQIGVLKKAIGQRGGGTRKAAKISALVAHVTAKAATVASPPPPPAPPPMTAKQRKAAAVTAATAAVTAAVTAITNRQPLSSADLSALAGHLQVLTKPQIKALTSSVAWSSSTTTKSFQINRIVNRITNRSQTYQAISGLQPAPAPAPASAPSSAPTAPVPAAAPKLPSNLPVGQGGAPPTPLYTGIDANGHHWVNGKQVAKPPDETHWEAGKPAPGSLNGIDFKPAPPKFWEKAKDVDIGEPAPLKKIDRVSVMIQEPDGRIWIVQPTNGFGNRKFTMAGGGVEPGLTNQQNALKEVWEETGLQVEITGHAGDFIDSNNGNNGRLYIGKRVGGAPWDAKVESFITNNKTGKPAAESEAVSLVTPEAAARLLHRTDDLAQLATVRPIPLDTPTSGKGSEPLKKLLAGIQPKAKAYAAKQKAAGKAVGNADLHAVQEMRGFNAKPKTVSQGDFDALIAGGDHIEMLRGVSGFGNMTSQQLADEFRNGEHFPGHGCFGAGTYCDSTKGSANAAASYAGSSGGSLLRIALPKTARIIKQSELEKLVPKEPADAVTYGHHPRNEEWWGVQAALAGYDAIEVDGKSKRHYSYGKGYYVILNRGAVVVQDTNAPRGHKIT